MKRVSGQTSCTSPVTPPGLSRASRESLPGVGGAFGDFSARGTFGAQNRDSGLRKGCPANLPSEPHRPRRASHGPPVRASPGSASYVGTFWRGTFLGPETRFGPSKGESGQTPARPPPTPPGLSRAARESSPGVSGSRGDFLVRDAFGARNGGLGLRKGCLAKLPREPRRPRRASHGPIVSALPQSSGPVATFCRGTLLGPETGVWASERGVRPNSRASPDDPAGPLTGRP